MTLHVIQANQHLKTEKRKDARSILLSQPTDTNITLDAQTKKNRQTLAIKHTKVSYMEPNEHHKSTMSPSSGPMNNQPFIINTNKFDVKVDVDNLEYDSDQEELENDTESSEQIEIELKDDAYINSHTVIDKDNYGYWMYNFKISSPNSHAAYYLKPSRPKPSPHVQNFSKDVLNESKNRLKLVRTGVSLIHGIEEEVDITKVFPSLVEKKENLRDVLKRTLNATGSINILKNNATSLQSPKIPPSIILSEPIVIHDIYNPISALVKVSQTSPRLPKIDGKKNGDMDKNDTDLEGTHGSLSFIDSYGRVLSPSQSKTIVKTIVKTKKKLPKAQRLRLESDNGIRDTLSSRPYGKGKGTADESVLLESMAGTNSTLSPRVIRVVLNSWSDIMNLSKFKKQEEMTKMLHKRETDRERIYKKKKELAKIIEKAEEKAQKWQLYRQNEEPENLNELWGSPSKQIDNSEKRLERRKHFYNDLLKMFEGEDKKSRTLNTEAVRFLLSELQQYMYNDWELDPKFFFTVVSDIGYQKFEVDNGTLQILNKMKEECHIKNQEWDNYVEKWTNGRRSVARFLKKYHVHIPLNSIKKV